MAKPETIAKRYAERIVKILNRIRDQCVEEGLVCTEVTDVSTDQYCWSFVVRTAGEKEDWDDKDIELSFNICESEEYDGSKGGVNFALDIVSVGGIIIGGLTPYNYTSEVWVKRSDPEAVAERFQIMQNADNSGVATLIKDHVKRNAK